MISKGLAFALALLLLVLGPANQARAKVICTFIADAPTGAIIFEEGMCDRRMTPASTFKVALAVIGYDTGVLKNADGPILAYQQGDPDWGGRNWTRDTNPRDWMRFSVVWYSQRITRALGAEALRRYAQEFGFGNADFSGDAGSENGLERAWLSSSLLISPREQVQFLRRLVQRDLPVSQNAMAQAQSLVQSHPTAGWQVYGKTGGAYPRKADRLFDEARSIGWFVGWATKDGRTVVFARLSLFKTRTERSPGILTREGVLADWASLIAR